MYAIECKSIYKTYGDKNALDGLNLSVDEDKVIGLVGRNGAGKTTFLKMCAGQIRQSKGDILVMGKAPFDKIEILSKVVFAADELPFDPSLKIQTILSFAQTHFENWDMAFAQELLKRFDLSERQKVKKLSKGMRSMLGTVVALSSRCPITLLDEPTAGLDTAHRKEFYNIIREEAANQPRTLLISSHLLSEIEPLLEEIVLIDEGKLIWQGPAEELRGFYLQVEGATAMLEPLASKYKVYDRIDIMGKTRFVLKHSDLNSQDWEVIRSNSIEYRQVTAQDASIYMTSKEAK